MITPEELLAGTFTYFDPKILTDGEWKGQYAHVAQMLFTCAVMVSSSETGDPIVRWCFATRREAKASLEAWTGTGDPPGKWIKRKPDDVSRMAA